MGASSIGEVAACLVRVPTENVKQKQQVMTSAIASRDAIFLLAANPVNHTGHVLLAVNQANLYPSMRSAVRGILDSQVRHRYQFVHLSKRNQTLT